MQGIRIKDSKNDVWIDLEKVCVVEPYNGTEGIEITMISGGAILKGWDLDKWQDFVQKIIFQLTTMTRR